MERKSCLCRRLVVSREQYASKRILEGFKQGGLERQFERQDHRTNLEGRFCYSANVEPKSGPEQSATGSLR